MNGHKVRFHTLHGKESNFEYEQKSNIYDNMDDDKYDNVDGDEKDAADQEGEAVKRFETPISKEDYVFWQGYDQLAPMFRANKDRKDLPINFTRYMWESSVNLGFKGPTEFHDFVENNIDDIKKQIRKEDKEKDKADLKWQAEEAEKFRVDLAKARTEEPVDDVGIMPEKMKHKDKIKAAAVERKRKKEEKKREKPKVTPEQRGGNKKLFYYLHI